MNQDRFHFKKFSVSHNKSSMKVGVDAVMIGGWAFPEGRNILDVGCGCGVIALMMAQRNEYAEITAIDIDPESVKEANDNFQISPWHERLKAFECSFQDLCFDETKKYDNIISNPPFYNSGVKEINTTRIIARHQGNLDFHKLINGAASLLNQDGRLSFILPFQLLKTLPLHSKDESLMLQRVCNVVTVDGKLPKRSMVEYVKKEKTEEIEYSILIIKNISGEFSSEYLNLYKDFYLKF